MANRHTMLGVSSCTAQSVNRVIYSVFIHTALLCIFMPRYINHHKKLAFFQHLRTFINGIRPPRTHCPLFSMFIMYYDAPDIAWLCRHKRYYNGFLTPHNPLNDVIMSPWCATTLYRERDHDYMMYHWAWHAATVIHAIATTPDIALSCRY